MTDEQSKQYTPEQAQQMREDCLEYQVMPAIREIFTAHPSLQSAAMLLAQFWNDEADDAVHSDLLFSELPSVDVAAAYAALNEDEDGLDEVNLPSGLAHWDFATTPDGCPSWDSNHDAVSLFAAYCKEGCDQEMDQREAYSLYARFQRRAGGSIDYQVVAVMLRPWLDGVCAQWGNPTAT